MSLALKHFYSFGDFTVDVEQKVLLRNATPLALAPKVFDTLMILLDNGGRIVEKEDLMKRLWPDTFVEESNLTFNIQQLRKSLGDNAREPKFIETVPRRGYRFIADVTRDDPVSTSVSPEAHSSTNVRAVPRFRTPYLLIAAVLILIVGLLVVALWSARRRNSAFASSSAPILSAPFKSEKLVADTSVRAVITPDGKYMAYTIESGGKESVWLRQLETSENIQIVSPINARYFGLATSPDGNTLYFARRDAGGTRYRTIYRVMTFGGIPVKIVENTEGWIGVAPDGKRLSFVRCKYEQEDYCSLLVINTDGTNERRLLTRQHPNRISDNQFSPDGKSLAFAAGHSSAGGSDFKLMLLDLTSGTERQITSKTFFDIPSLKWLPDGDSLLLTAKEPHDGRLRIWHVSVSTGEARIVTNDAADYGSLSLDRAADKLIATLHSNTFHLYVARMDALNNPKNLAAALSGVHFTPDGNLIYAGSDADIWTINPEGGEKRQLTNNAFNDISPRVSPDNRYIFFSSNRSGSTQVWRMNTDGSSPIQLTSKVGGYPRFISSDGKWVYFFSGVNDNVWKVSADGGEETQVPMPLSSFSPDGKLAAFFAPDKADNNRIKLTVMSVEDRKVVKTFNLNDETSRPTGIDLISGWVADNTSFYYITNDGSRNHLWKQMLNADTPQLIGDLGTEEIAHFVVAPDGLSFAMIRGKWLRDAVLIEGLQ